MSDLEKLKTVFSEIGVPFIERDEGEGYITILTVSDEEQRVGKLLSPYRDYTFFEFLNGKLASSP